MSADKQFKGLNVWPNGRAAFVQLQATYCRSAKCDLMCHRCIYDNANLDAFREWYEREHGEGAV